MALLEEPSEDVVANFKAPDKGLGFLNKSHAIDYSDRYPFTKGNKLGILTDENNNPIQELESINIDVETTSLKLKSYLKGEEYIEGSGTILITELVKLSDINEVGGKFWKVVNNKFVYYDPSSGPDYSDCLSMSDEEKDNLNTAFVFLSSTPMDKTQWCSATSLYYNGSQYGDDIPIFPSEIGYLSNLVSIELVNSSNGFSFVSLPSELGFLINLEILTIGIGNLSELPSTIGTLINLTELNIRNNNLTTIPDSIGNLINLVNLHLHYNNISNLSATLNSLDKLTNFFINNNNSSLGLLNQAFNSNDTTKVCNVVGTNGENICIQYVTDSLNITIE
ncbi:MAG: hypothetical protein Q9M94_05025 [Candidatus Gracilibacteria bacterium]|nr:hypothetical protein [Candidatus Gracilibacteria bacterium]MDQ7023743.1 hypothetical protein [Candidatus Gracilibacteria bacterium]